MKKTQQAILVHKVLVDVLELVQIMDLAERFNLAGLKEKTISHVHEMFFFPKERGRLFATNANYQIE